MTCCRAVFAGFALSIFVFVAGFVSWAQAQDAASQESAGQTGELPPPISDRRRREHLTTRGGDENTEAAVTAALAWLAGEQRDDGGWSSAPLGDHDTGVTGLALLAFTARGIGPTDAEHGPVVKKAAAFLLSRQTAHGLFSTGDLATEVLERRRNPPEPGETREWGRRQPRDVYDHAIATVALGEVLLLVGDDVLREPIESAARWIEEQRNPYLAWGYVPARRAPGGLSVTAWNIHALWTARAAGLTVPWDKHLGGDWPARGRGPVQGAHALLGRLRNMPSGRSAYADAGRSPNARAADERNGTAMPHPYRAGTKASEFGEAMTAKDAAVTLLIGAALDRVTASSLDVIAARPPAWTDDATVDLYSWYWGTLALSQRGGTRWPAWNRTLKNALLPHQGEDGSWAPVGVWGTAGRVYSTAIACLCLESYYRYDLLDLGSPASEDLSKERGSDDTTEKR